MDQHEAMKWWLAQGDNKDFEVTKTAVISAGRWGFCEVFWKHRGLAGRDRIYKRGKGYELIEIMQ